MGFRRCLVVLAGVAAVAALSGCSGLSTKTGELSTVSARSAAAEIRSDVCELCLKPLVAEFEVVLQSARELGEHHYRCIHCALVAARDRFRGDVRLRAKSAVKGVPVELARKGSEWEAVPASARVLTIPEANDECLEGHVVLADEAEFEAYAREHPVVAGAETFGATEVARILAAGKPAAPGEATCPVSGQTVEVEETTLWTVYRGEVYYFCCKGCKPRFLANADAYLKGEGPKPPMMGSGSCGGSCGGSQGADSGGGCGGASGHSPSEGGGGEEPAQEKEQGEPGS